MSARGNCIECANGLRDANAYQLVAHRGPFFDHWRARSLAALGVTLTHEAPSER